MEKVKARKSSTQRKPSRKFAAFLVVVIAVAAVVVLLVWSPWDNADAQRSSEQIAAGIPADLDLGDNPEEGFVAEQPEEAQQLAEDSEIFDNPEAHQGESVILQGEIYGEPAYNQGILTFNLKTAGGNYVMVNMLDEDEQSELKSGDTVEVVANVTAQGTSMDEAGAEISVVMLNADSVEPVTE